MVRILYRTARTGHMMNAYVGAVIVGTFGWGYHAEGIWWWTVVFFGLLAARVLQGEVFCRREVADADMGKWKLAFMAGAACTGLMWGLAAWFFWPVNQTIPWLILIFVVAGMNAGAARTLASEPLCFLIYAVLSMTPLMARLAEMPERGRWVLLVMLLSNIVFLWRTTLLQRADLLGLYKARFENEALVARLKEEKHRVEVASAAKSDFLATMSHEIRTPMNGVIGMLQILQESKLDTESQQYVGMAFKSAEGLMKMLDDVLDLVEAEGNRLNLERVGFDPEEHFKGMASMLESAAVAKKLAFRIEAKGSASFVLGDPARLRQLLTNLVGNAVKFTERGMVSVSLVVEPPVGEECRLVYVVQDTGIGMSPETKALLFQNFFQADGGSTRRYGGMGLGLPIAQHLARRMGGVISVESELGQGSRFSFEVKLAVASRVSAHRVAKV